MYNSDPAIYLCPRVTYCRAVIRRAVIDKDYLKVRIRLPNNAFDALIEIFFNFVNRDYYAYHLIYPIVSGISAKCSF